MHGATKWKLVFIVYTELTFVKNNLTGSQDCQIVPSYSNNLSQTWKKKLTESNI